MRVSDIHTTNWQMGLKRSDTIVAGTEDIGQCIEVILKTRKGEDPLGSHFGCNLFDRVDAPVNSAIPIMKKDILESLKQFEPRIKVTSLTVRLEGDSRVLFDIGYQTPEGDLEVYEFSMTGGRRGMWLFP